MRWRIPELGHSTSEGAVLEFEAEHIGPCTGTVEVNESISYTDDEKNVVSFPSPEMEIDCGVVVTPEPCPQPVNIRIEGCEDAVVFDAGELDKASELTVLAAALCDSEADDAELSRAVERLPGLDERLRGMLTGICRALRSADNAAICASLMPESDAPGRDEEMFLPEPDAGEELAAADEFAPSDEYEYEPAEQEWEEPGAVGPYEGAPEPAPEADEGPAQYVRARLEQGGRAGVPLEMRVAAILALARALGSERLQDVSVRLSGRGMIVRAVPRERALLETLEFKYHAELFERAFGIRARLKLVKRRPGAGNR